MKRNQQATTVTTSVAKPVTTAIRMVILRATVLGAGTSCVGVDFDIVIDSCPLGALNVMSALVVPVLARYGWET